MDNLDPAPDVIAEIDRLVAVSRNAPQDMAAMDAMWRALYALDAWLFLARGELDAPRPWSLSLPEGPMVLAFTTAARAQEAGRAAGFSEEEVAHILAVPMPGAIEWVAGLGSAGLVGVVFDYGVSAAFAPLRNLIPMRDWMAEHPPAG